MSCVARALPAKRVWIQPSRISRATCARRAGVDDRRAADEQDLLALGPRRADRLGHAPQADRLGLLARDGRAHEPEEASPRGAARAGTTRTPGVADDDRHARASTSVIGTHRAVPPAGSTTMPQSISWSATSTQWPSEPDLGPLVGRAVEVLGEGPGDVGRHDPGVLGVDRRGAVLDQVAEDRVDRLGGRRPGWRSGRSSGPTRRTPILHSRISNVPPIWRIRSRILGRSSESTMWPRTSTSSIAHGG